MSKIVLISCVSQKNNFPCKAKDLYISPLFIKSLKYAKQLNPDKIYILSAKYGLLDSEKIVEPYNMTLKDFSKKEKLEWAQKVLIDLHEQTSLRKDEFIILAGSVYCENLLKHIKNYTLPMGNLPIGKRLKWLTENTQENIEGLLF